MATAVYRQRVEPIRYVPSPQIQTQPRQDGGHVNVLVSQPGSNVWFYEYPWSSGVCSCCDDGKQCSPFERKCSPEFRLISGCYACFCPCCFQCELFKRTGENQCACFCPGSLFALRTKIRTAFRIDGDLCNDCCVTFWCPCCAAIQLMRELKYQGL